ncbi:ABC transporter substrate-binding protein [Labrys wisconsinensis]|uniref:ABC-type glycerol-3-phosphate transport system substrate-binding protein n=1 Tax=Labrys wisconsinensis TaxID=425677 RepID=A0ABU0J6H3_9HYPH|nr:sugar ABC transporter substrate-binding protein [Labrys wisconsinensis]MDQ0469866.1 ABC-type glycerol-3-phosphate transport system substrate-binding protein [Labrys wisconsinensis]
MRRRDFIALLGTTMAMPALMLGRSRAEELGKTDWKAHKGTTLNLFLSRHPWQEAIEPLLPAFEDLTGITVQASKLPEQQYLTKVVTDLSAKAFQQDVFMTQYYEAPRFQAEGWTADLKPLMDKAALTDPAWYDWNDFFPSARNIATIGRRYADRVALTSEAQILVYRKDVLSEASLPVPADFDGLIKTAQAISAKGPISGITLRGGPTNWWPLYGVVRSYGGDYLDDKLTPVVASAESKAGLEAFAKLAAAAPQGVTSYDWDEINTAMLSGQAAMFLDSSVIYGRLQDPKLSTVTGKVAAAPFPTGPGGRHGHSHYWSISIASASRNPEAAWLFVQWATSKATQLALARKGIFPPRTSVAQSPELEATFGKDFLSAVGTSLASAVISPANLKFNELMDPLRAATQEVILGNTDASAALDGVEEQWKRILA